MKNNRKGKIIIPAGRKPWPHELRTANILAEAGYIVEFLPESNIKTADILLNGIKFEIKSPFSAKTNSLEHIIKKAIKQSPNLIIDISRIKKIPERNIKKFLETQCQSRKSIKRLIIVTKRGKILDLANQK